MEKFCKFANVTDFLHSLKEDTLDGVYTARLTPCKLKKWNEDANLSPQHIDNTVSQWCSSLAKDKKFTKCMVFKEIGNTVGIHYHFRFVTNYKSELSVRHLFTQHWIPDPNMKSKGNWYSIRNCKSKDKKIWTNATYVAKGGDVVYSFNYTQSELDTFCFFAKEYSDMCGKLKHEQILFLYSHTLNSANTHKAATAYECIISFHERKHKAIPEPYAIKNLMHNILMKISSSYRKHLKEHCINNYAFKCGDFALPSDQELYNPFD